MNFDKLENGSRKTKSVVEVLRIKQEDKEKDIRKVKDKKDKRFR